MQEKEKVWEANQLELQKQLKEVTQKEIKLPKSDEDIEAWATQYPDVAAIVETIAIKKAREQAAGLEDRVKEIDEMKATASREKAEVELMKAHPDFGEIRDSDAFHEWAEEGRARVRLRGCCTVTGVGGESNGCGEEAGLGPERDRKRKPCVSPQVVGPMGSSLGARRRKPSGCGRCSSGRLVWVYLASDERVAARAGLSSTRRKPDSTRLQLGRPLETVRLPPTRRSNSRLR